MSGLALPALTILTISSALTSAITAATGMGGGVLMLILMNFFMPLNVVIPLHGVIQMQNNAFRSWILRKNINWRINIPFIIGAVLGVITAWLFLQKYTDKTIPYIILFILINYTVFKPKRLPHFKIKDNTFGIVGFITGILGILVGAVDPFISLFFLRDDMTKEEMVANKSFMQAVIHTLKLPVFIFLGFNYTEHLSLLLLLIFAGLLGTRWGIWILNRLHQELFNLIVKVTLFLSGIKILYDVIK